MWKKTYLEKCSLDVGCMLIIHEQNEMPHRKILFKCLKISCKIISVNSELKNTRKINFDNRASQI